MRHLVQVELGAGHAERRDEDQRGDASSLAAASIATEPPSPWPTTAMRLRSTSLRSAQELHGGAHDRRRKSASVAASARPPLWPTPRLS